MRGMGIPLIAIKLAMNGAPGIYNSQPTTEYRQLTTHN